MVAQALLVVPPVPVPPVQVQAAHVHHVHPTVREDIDTLDESIIIIIIMIITMDTTPSYPYCYFDDVTTMIGE